MEGAEAIPAGEVVATADHRVVMSGLSWADYEALLRVRGESSAPRVAYLAGVLELMSPSKDHERIKSTIGRLVEAYAIERGIELSPYGSWTLKQKTREAGAEPDECYLVGDDQERLTPDLAIEVLWTSGGLDKLEIYRRLEVPEVWFWNAGAIEVFALAKERYERAARSHLFPELDLELLTSHLDRSPVTRAVREFLAALRGR